MIRSIQIYIFIYLNQHGERWSLHPNPRHPYPKNGDDVYFSRVKINRYIDILSAKRGMY